MRCYRKLLGITYYDRITNEEVKSRVQNAIRHYTDLQKLVKQRELNWYGHLTRSSSSVKAIMLDTGQGGRTKGRQRKRWGDNIRHWTELRLPDTTRRADTKEEWKKCLVKMSSVAPA